MMDAKPVFGNKPQTDLCTEGRTKKNSGDANLRHHAVLKSP
jgi:hypothetical protein